MPRWREAVVVVMALGLAWYLGLTPPARQSAIEARVNQLLDSGRDAAQAGERRFEQWAAGVRPRLRAL